jgi:predicted aspartyl protease
MKSLLRAVLTGILLVAMPAAGLCDIYKYRDAQGRLNFVDDASKVPAQYRDQVTTLSEAGPSPAVRESQGEDHSWQEAPPDTRQTPDAEPDRESRADYLTPVEISGNRVLVPVEVALGNRAVKLRLLLDTGATVTVFHRQSLEDLQLPSGTMHKARVAGGSVVNSRKIRFRRLRVGPFLIEKPYAMVIAPEGRQLPFDGMLGMDFLKNHHYRIDFQKKLIIWEAVE